MIFSLVSPVRKEIEHAVFMTEAILEENPKTLRWRTWWGADAKKQQKGRGTV
ncbi:MAG: hypothetical protein AAFY09_13105 [Pseudomonadota bacterium]